ncbi:hypothetical protein WR25_07713 isoform B [Diploscapter pachys]|uniref:Pyridoxal kinase n=1 Tax=Diploscapter pachys TaxID=2018661 RepID=A0A2A2L175_9BILA|nr:hypothetical protein WR25_07713 isoform B [Diploscapter pachys]
MSSDLDAALQKSRDKRVLSIQSHVVHGYAGNKCSVFPLQMNGFEVDFINSVQFSNHAGYSHVKGQKLTDAELSELYEGLKLNDLLHYTHILTGYCGNITFLQRIADVVKDIKQRNPQAIFVCDPVMGDNGHYYCPPDLMPVYRDTIVPLADVLTPNAFELGELTGMQVDTEESCLQAVNKIHALGVRIVVVTSGIEKAQKEGHLNCYTSIREPNGDTVRTRFVFPRLDGAFVGTGDAFTSLLLVRLDDCNGNVAEAVGQVLGSMQALIRRTSEFAQNQVDSNSRAMCELRLIESRKDLLVPQQKFQGERIEI